jgi:hypothetical protein
MVTVTSLRKQSLAIWEAPGMAGPEYKTYNKTSLTTTALVNAGFNEKRSATGSNIQLHGNIFRTPRILRTE